MLSAKGASILYLSLMLESGNVKYKQELLLFTVHCKVITLTCLLVEVSLSYPLGIWLLLFNKQIGGRLKGICHSLFVITRTQLNLNKIVISKQYLESHNVTHVRKGTNIASTVLKIILTGKKFIWMIMPQWISQNDRYVQSDRDSFMQWKVFRIRDRDIGIC